MFARRAKALFEETGQRLPVLWISAAALIIGGYIFYLVSGSPLSFDEPVLGRFNFKEAGSYHCHFSHFGSP